MPRQVLTLSRDVMSVAGPSGLLLREGDVHEPSVDLQNQVAAIARNLNWPLL